MTNFTVDEIDDLRQDIGLYLLDQVCDIRRSTDTENPYGSVGVEWDDHLQNIPCHLLTLREREVLGPLIQVVQTYDYLDIPFGIDVTEDDQIWEIRNQKGEVIGQNYDVTGVTARPSHFLLTLRSDDG